MITTVISFCTQDARFLKNCIEAVSQFSNQILIVVSDHFFDGREENYLLLEELYKKFFNYAFIEFVYDEQALYGTLAHLVPGSPDWTHHWHNTARLIGYHHAREENEWILFCDVDEIFEPEKMTRWLQEFDIERYSALRFSCYWYFREARFQATTWPDSPLLVKKEAIHPEMLLDEDERMGLYCNIQGVKERLVCGLDQKPLVHHFSWVRTKEEMLLKARSWGHHWERNWPLLIEEEFSREFNGTDFVRRYSYKEVEPLFDPLKEELPRFEHSISLREHLERIKGISNVTRVTAKEIFRKGVEWMIKSPH